LKNEVSLFVFKLSNLVVRFHVVVVQTLAKIIFRKLFWVEHMSTQIHHCSLVNFLILIVMHRFFRVLFDKSSDPLRKADLL
ncbi:MAG: hypothetical protein ACK55Z_14550, partial [bacterium]